MSLYVHYRVPLVAEVEIETAQVVSVHLADEAIEGPFTVTADRGELPREDRRRGRRLARGRTIRMSTETAPNSGEVSAGPPSALTVPAAARVSIPMRFGRTRQRPSGRPSWQSRLVP